MKRLFLTLILVCALCEANAVIVLSEVHVNVSCYGFCNGLINVTASGGVLPYNYTGLPSGPICPGTYTITVTDAVGQTASISVTITEPPLLVTNASNTDVTCNGACDGTASMTVTGGTSPYTYAWCNGSTVGSGSGFCAGSCTVTVTDSNGCEAIDTVVITEPLPIQVTETITDASCSSCCDGSIQIIPITGFPPYTYNWSPGSPIGDGTPTISSLCPNTYSYCITDMNGCQLCDSVTVSFPLAIMNFEFDYSYSLFPNPANNFIDVETETTMGIKNCEISIFDIMGKLILKEKMIQEKIRINLSEFSNGIYFMQLQSGDKMINKKFIKE